VPIAASQGRERPERSSVDLELMLAWSNECGRRAAYRKIAGHGSEG
jgi:hypothetical protein